MHRAFGCLHERGGGARGFAGVRPTGGTDGVVQLAVLTILVSTSVCLQLVGLLSMTAVDGTTGSGVHYMYST